MGCGWGGESGLVEVYDQRMWVMACVMGDVMNGALVAAGRVQFGNRRI